MLQLEFQMILNIFIILFVYLEILLWLNKMRMNWNNILRNLSRRIRTVQISINYMKSRRNMCVAQGSSSRWGRSTRKSHLSLSQLFFMESTILISCWVLSQKLLKSWIKTPSYWVMYSMKKCLGKWGRIHSKYMKSQEIISCKKRHKKLSC